MADVYAACLHEAGHAIAGMASHVRVTSVWVRGATGMCCYSGRSNALTALAGPCAEYHLKHPETRPAAESLLRQLANGQRDVVDAVQLLEGRVDGDRLVEVWLKARELVVDEWPAIVRVAQALQRYGRLTAAEVRAVWSSDARAA